MANPSSGNGATSEMTALRADLDGLRETLAELTRSLHQTGRDGAAVAAGEARNFGDKAGQVVKAGTDRIARAVQERPALACGVAIGVGALIGAALLRRG